MTHDEPGRTAASDEVSERAFAVAMRKNVWYLDGVSVVDGGRQFKEGIRRPANNFFACY